MRKVFCETMVSHANRPDFVFLTGDLGFKAFEPARQALGSRFINAGVAEQNMISVAAGLARNGYRVWTYSIAPFIYARPFEQIRNDVCLHRLPVVLVGNGGGYGYGVMGASHHALEDYGILTTLAGLKIFVPAFDSDVPTISEAAFELAGPTYVRLGLSEEPKGWSPSSFSPWRKLLNGSAGTLVAVGPLAGNFWGACAERREESRPNLWCVSQLPLENLPDELLNDIQRSSVLCVAEEHVATGSLGAALATKLLEARCVPARFIHRTALGYPSGRYGSQQFHRRECGLDAASVLEAVTAAKECA